MVDSTDKTNSDFYTDMPVGEILRRGREHFGQSLEDVERNLRIRALQLHALETGDIEQLPGKAYALGFVRSYSEYLGLDGEKMVQLFKRQTLGAKIEPNLHFPTPASESKLPGMAFAFILALIGIGVIWWWMSAQQEDRSVVAEIPAVSETAITTPSSIPESPPVVQAAANNTQEVNGPMSVPSETQPSSGESAEDNDADLPADENGNVVTAAEGETPAQTAPVTENAVTAEVTSEVNETPAAAPESGIILNIKENSWVEIRDATGKALVSRVLKAGDQYYVPDRADLNMSLGNAAGIEIVIEGQTLPFLGARGEVIRNISLDGQSLKSLARR